MIRTLAAGLLLASLAMPLHAAPPAGSMAASEVLRMVEQRPDFRHLEDMEWDSDGYWEVEYVAHDGSKVKLRVDPASGQARGR